LFLNQSDWTATKVQQVEEESRKLQITLKALQDDIENEKKSQGKSPPPASPPSPCILPLIIKCHDLILAPHVLDPP
jgi:hypothetical protein